MALAMAVQSSAVKARLQQKAASRPHKMMRKLYPDGTGAIGEVPKRKALGDPEDEAATEEFCAAVRKVATVFGKGMRAQEYTQHVSSTAVKTIQNKKARPHMRHMQMES